MGLHVYFYRSNDLKGCSNHGVSETKGIKGLTITNIDAPFKPSREYPPAKLIVEKHFKDPTVRVVPEALLLDGLWTMMGGS